ncbi:hypothetical protein P9112_001053 [Eukaryota sp. TZLM1-RC]
MRTAGKVAASLLTGTVVLAGGVALYRKFVSSSIDVSDDLCFQSLHNDLPCLLDLLNHRSLRKRIVATKFLSKLSNTEYMTKLISSPTFVGYIPTLLSDSSTCSDFFNFTTRVLSTTAPPEPFLSSIISNFHHFLLRSRSIDKASLLLLDLTRSSEGICRSVMSNSCLIDVIYLCILDPEPSDTCKHNLVYILVLLSNVKDFSKLLCNKDILFFLTTTESSFHLPTCSLLANLSRCQENHQVLINFLGFISRLINSSLEENRFGESFSECLRSLASLSVSDQVVEFLKQSDLIKTLINVSTSISPNHSYDLLWCFWIFANFCRTLELSQLLIKLNIINFSLNILGGIDELKRSTFSINKLNPFLKLQIGRSFGNIVEVFGDKLSKDNFSQSLLIVRSLLTSTTDRVRNQAFIIVEHLLSINCYKERVREFLSINSPLLIFIDRTTASSAIKSRIQHLGVNSTGNDSFEIPFPLKTGYTWHCIFNEPLPIYLPIPMNYYYAIDQDSSSNTIYLSKSPISNTRFIECGISISFLMGVSSFETTPSELGFQFVSRFVAGVEGRSDVELSNEVTSSKFRCFQTFSAVITDLESKYTTEVTQSQIDTPIDKIEGKRFIKNFVVCLDKTDFLIVFNTQSSQDNWSEVLQIEQFILNRILLDGFV